MYLLNPDAADLDEALKAWAWIVLEDKTPVAVTAFGDVFFVALSGIWFLDTVEGTLSRVCGSREELATILASDEGKNHYLLAGLVQRMMRDGITLSEGECFAFSQPPIQGGAIAVANVNKSRLVEALARAGKLHGELHEGRVHADEK